MTFLLRNLRGVLVLLAMGLNTGLHGAVLLSCALLKFLAPEGAWRDRVRRLLTAVAESWIGVNNALLALDGSTSWDADLPAELRRDGCYLVLCNHQSWVDILVLQRCFNRRLPLLRFFLKRQLIWVPVLGLCWWALDFPFMHRASREEVARRPELRGRDLESARRACEKFRDLPVAMMSFPEGTRRAGAKRRKRGEHEHLLKPKAGGVGQVLYALGDELDACVDVTLVYEGPGGSSDEAPTLWDLVKGDLERIRIHAEAVPLPASLLGKNFTEDLAAREALQAWVGERWGKKDARIGAMLDPA